MKNTFTLLLLCVANSACHADGVPAYGNKTEAKIVQTAVTPDCRSGDACGKIGAEDKQMILVEQDRARRKNLIKNGTDRERWADPIYSDATRPDDLQLLLVKSSGLTMRLAPKLGVLYFESPGKKHAFKIAAAPGEAGAMCPRYNFTVISASQRHAFINKDCPAFEYKANRSAMSSEYILYDIETGTTKSIWYATASKGEKFPFADPTPDVKLEKNGYRFQWTGIYPGVSGDTVSLNSSFSVARDPESGKKYLECRDLRRTKQEQLDSEACQGLMLFSLPEKK
jgi:hypothetical protein